MTEISTSQSSQFFGKDGLKPFVGVVEDVNDPKQAGRVKVRCVGWHPVEKKGEEGLSTDDIPWARVSAPTTHAQQSRVGSKHGLLPGCWVWGFWLDDDDTQKPMVCGSFPFTAKAADKDTRQIDSEAEENPGTQSENIEAFSHVDASTRGPNTQTRTAKERGGGRAAFDPADPAAAAPSLDDSTTNECGELISANSKAKVQPLKVGEQGNAQSLDVNKIIGDGACGSVAHGTSDIQKMMVERMPSAFARFAYGDMVWNKYTGAFLNMNGILAQMSLDICSIIKMILTQLKAFQEENINRPTKGAMCLAATERDGAGTLIVDETSTIKDDIFHTIFTMLMEQMCGQIFDMLKDMDNGGNNQGDNNDGGGGGGLGDPGADCVTEQIMHNIAVMANDMILEALRQADEKMSQYSRAEYKRIEMTYRADVKAHLIEEDNITGTSDFSLLSYKEMLDKVLQEFDEEDAKQKAELKRVEKEYGESQSGDEGNEFSGVLSMLGSVGNIMQFSSMSKYAMIGAKTHNRSGNATQDERLRNGGCKMERIYNTVEGAVGSLSGGMSGGLGGVGGSLMGAAGLAGSLGGGTGGSSATGSGKGSRGDGSGKRYGSDRLDRITNIGFGGLDSKKLSFLSNTNCETLIDYDRGTGVGDGTGIPFPIYNPPSDESPIIDIGTGKDGKNGKNADVIAISLPSDDPCLADNFRHGTPTNMVVINHGRRYNNFPSIFIPDYNGTPVPVINSSNGEIVAVLSNCKSWNPNQPNPSVSVIADNGVTGIDIYDNEDYDLVLGGFFIGNIGQGYCDPKIEILDYDTNQPNGEVKVVMVQNRIVDVEIINNGQGFKRIPKVKITDDCGYGAKIYPIMSLVPRPQAKEYPITVMMIYCPSKNQRNYTEN